MLTVWCCLQSNNQKTSLFRQVWGSLGDRSGRSLVDGSVHSFVDRSGRSLCSRWGGRSLGGRWGGWVHLMLRLWFLYKGVTCFVDRSEHSLCSRWVDVVLGVGESTSCSDFGSCIKEWLVLLIGVGVVFVVGGVDVVLVVGRVGESTSCSDFGSCIKCNGAWPPRGPRAIPPRGSFPV